MKTPLRDVWSSLLFASVQLTFHYILCTRSSTRTNLLTADGSHFNLEESGVTINILFLAELSNCELSENGKLELQSAALAVSLANSRNIIPGYRLQLSSVDTQCNAGHAIYAYLQAISQNPRIQFLLGPSHDEVALVLARTTPYWSMIQISAGSTSPALSDRTHFRSFFRTVTPDQSHNAARRGFLRHFDWHFVATINENLEAYALATNELVKSLAQQNLTFVATGSIGESKIQSQLLLFKEKDVRIIFASFSMEFARKVFCEAYHLGLYGARYVWFIPGTFPNQWWIDRENSTSCSDDQVEAAIQGHITVTTSDVLFDNKRSDAGITYDEFVKLQGGSSYSPQVLAFDAVWTIAKTVQKALPILKRRNLSPLNFTYRTRQSMEIMDIYSQVISHLEFDGISGRIKFNGADRVGVSVFRQFHQKEYKTIAMYYPEQEYLAFNCSSCNPIVWSGDRVPTDHWQEIMVIEGVDPQVLYGMAILSSLGMLVASSFLYFNFHYRAEKFVKLSSPKLNNTTALGCCLVYAAIITLGVDFGITADTSAMKSICQIRIFLISTGFSVAFGSLFLKTFRVHQIFRRASRGVIKSRLLQDNQLLCGVVSLFGVDCLFLTIWFLTDPIRVELRALPELHPEPDIVLKRQVEICDSDLMEVVWLPIIYIYKGMMLLAGIFLTFETRHVKIPALNDSQAVGLSIYNVVICSVIAFALTQIIFDHHTLHYILISALAFSTTTGTLCFLFIPKILTVTKKTGEDPILSGSGLTEQNNTRRLNIEDPRERFVTAELLNRAYQSDLMKMDSEIRRMERTTQLPVMPCIKLSDEIFRSLPEYFVDSDSIVERYRSQEKDRNGVFKSLLVGKNDKMDKSLSFSDHNIDIIINDPLEDTMIMQTDEGNVTLKVTRDQKTPNKPAMVKFRKAMIRYKFIAVPVKPKSSAQDNEKRTEDGEYSALTDQN